MHEHSDGFYLLVNFANEKVVNKLMVNGMGKSYRTRLPQEELLLSAELGITRAITNTCYTLIKNSMQNPA
jgi:hypothetical protein